MVRTSQCFRTESPQLEGPPTLAAAEGILYTLVPPASLIKPRREYSPLDFSRRRKWHFLVSSISLGAHDGVPIHLSRSVVSQFSTAMPATSPDPCKDLEECSAR